MTSCSVLGKAANLVAVYLVIICIVSCGIAFMKSQFVKLTAITMIASSLISCGGGSGGDDGGFIGAANVSLRVSPDKIDTGDRSKVTINITDIHENGILLKVKVPKQLAYVPDTAFLYVNSDEKDIGPDKNVTKDNDSFLVFFLDQADFNDEDEGRIEFQLVGNDKVSEKEVQVDADVNDLQIVDSEEFSAESPEFGAEDAVSLEVTD